MSSNLYCKIFLQLLDAAVSAFFWREVQLLFYDRWNCVPGRLNVFAKLVWEIYVFKGHTGDEVGTMTPYCMAQ